MNTPNQPKEKYTASCTCHRCIAENKLTGSLGLPLSSSMMILCPQCGNKRCPKASDHRLECTGSNEPNQPGSVYQQPDYIEIPDFLRRNKD